MFLRSLLPQQKIRNLLARKARNLVKGDNISEALSTFAEVQREQQQLFMEKERRAQKELELEEKRMKLELENDQRREAFITQMIQIFAKSRHVNCGPVLLTDQV